MTRGGMVARLRASQGTCDLAIIGGGATGVGIAVAAASRGYRVVLFEQHDFDKGIGLKVYDALAGKYGFGRSSPPALR